MSISENGAAGKYHKDCPECGDSSEAMITTGGTGTAPGVWVRCACGALTWARKTSN